MSSRSIISILTALFALLVVLTRATNPGIRLRITNKGLQYVSPVVAQVLGEKVKNATIPDISGNAETPIGNVFYSLSSIQFNSMSIPSLSLKTDPGVGLQLQISGASSSLSGNWHYQLQWSHVSVNDSFDLDVSGLEATVKTKLGVDNKGRLTIAVTGCSSSVGKVKIGFHGGPSWLYKLFNSYIDKKIKEILRKKLCQETSDLIKDVGKALATFPVQQQINKYAVLDCSLISRPSITVSYVDIFIKGEFLSATSPKEAPFSPTLLPSESESDKMMYLWITDYVQNTAWLVFQQAGVLNQTITPSMLPNLLNTNAFKMAIPQLYQRYPNRPMKLVGCSTERPQISTSSAGVRLSMQGQQKYFVLLENGADVYTFTLGVEISFLTKLTVKESNLTGHVDTLKIKVHLIKSAIGDISFNMRLLQFFLDTVGDKRILELVNKIAAVGFPLPVVDGSQLVNAEVVHGQNFILIATDVKHAPTKHSGGKKSEEGKTKIILV